MANYNADDHGPPDSMGELKEAAEAIRSAGRGGDTILAHINPREAALLKAHGGSGAINPNTGLPEFDDFGFDYGDWGQSSSPYSFDFGAGSSTNYYSPNLDAMTGGYGSSDFTGNNSTTQTINDIYNGYINDLANSSIGQGANDLYASLSNSLQSNIAALPSASDVLSYITPSFDLPPDIQPQVQQPQFFTPPPIGGYDTPVTAPVVPSTPAPTGTIYYTVPSPTGGATLGVGADAVAQGLAGLAGQYGTIPGPEAVPPAGNDVPLPTPAEAAAQFDLPSLPGQVTTAQPIPSTTMTTPDIAAQMANINRLLDYSGGTVIGKSNATPVNTSTNNEISQPNVTLNYAAPTNTYAYDPKANVGVVGLNGPYGLASGEIGNGVGPGNVATMGFSDNTAAQPNVTLDYTAPATGVQIGGSQNLVGQFTVGGPEAYRGGVSNPYGDYTPVGPDEAATAGNLTVPNANFVGGGFSADLGPPIDGATLNTINVSQAPRGSGSLNPDLFSVAPTTDAVSRTLAEQNKALVNSNESTTNDTSNLPFGTGSPIGADGDGISSATPINTTTNTATDTTSAGSPSFIRKYLGASNDPYNYGFGSERQYYGSVPAAAKGGMFNADQYFADGGLVQPLSPPTTPLVSAQPTMAFTDGVGAVGSIAQPPGMYQSDAYGSDAPHASPMAPSVAAAVPSFQPGLATLATPNVNASPTLSPIAQNPNVGYATGNSPLSNLTRS